ncbi:MAG: hypothetical protein HZB50_06760 [Chloroflexi bacterium]|nr:hypothetical protein [Chloroflexota bacterium]
MAETPEKVNSSAGVVLRDAAKIILFLAVVLAAGGLGLLSGISLSQSLFSKSFEISKGVGLKGNAQLIIPGIILVFITSLSVLVYRMWYPAIRELRNKNFVWGIEWLKVIIFYCSSSFLAILLYTLGMLPFIFKLIDFFFMRR